MMTTTSTTNQTRNQRRGRLFGAVSVAITLLLSLLSAAPAVADEVTSKGGQELAPLTAAGEGRGAARASTPTYRVTISGTVSGRPFTRQAVVQLFRTGTRVTENGVNPFEVCLGSGFPAGRPETGAIQYGTNSGCFRSRGALVDMVYTAVRGNRFLTQPDGRLQATYLNNWTASNSIAACPYSPVEGATSYTITNQRISGSINLRGYGGAFCGWSTYRATISGVRVG